VSWLSTNVGCRQTAQNTIVGVLTSKIVTSKDRLFFISQEMPLSGRREWQLVWVNLEDSMALHSPCLTIGRYLVEFYLFHSIEVCFNANNLHLWLQYHCTTDIRALVQVRTHLINPSDLLEQLAKEHNFYPMHQWIMLTHESMYIHGPFGFAIIHGCKSCNRI
jgi:hypothetical protein